MIDWEIGLIITVYVLVIHTGIKLINRLFEKKKSKNSLF